ncbi:hypothetical protein PHISCL_08918 [Aspergillus sclerotialis]|uniref:Amino acid permease/ SLC12A domain-containing protein n=1 Tax=Aspergillus sclerotialis TaxID=2070753 RepID=A0A3A2ZHD9_9EURO|nr:hypothetical protein PHISCL_08918 [Aspergillus sclerotialis]
MDPPVGSLNGPHDPEANRVTSAPSIRLDTAGDLSKLDETEVDAAIMEAVNHRRLTPRQIQLTAFAGAIGAALFVAIGDGVPSGPLCMLIAFIFWASVIFSIAQCQNEIVTMYPLDGSFIRLAARMVDPALGVTAGWNVFFAQTTFVMFEATVINTLVADWGYDQSPAILISGTFSIRDEGIVAEVTYSFVASLPAAQCLPSRRLR